MTTPKELSDWFDYGVAEHATHMIIVCDTFDNEDYPVYVKPNEDVRERLKDYDNTNMQRVMEVYSLSRDKSAQLKEERAYHLD